MTRGPDGRPTLFTDIKPDQFPVTLTAFVDGEQVWERVIEPYVSVEIPPAGENAGKVALRVRFGDGREVWVDPMTAEEAEAHIEQTIKESRE